MIRVYKYITRTRHLHFGFGRDFVCILATSLLFVFWVVVVLFDTRYTLLYDTCCIYGVWRDRSGIWLILVYTYIHGADGALYYPSVYIIQPKCSFNMTKCSMDGVT